MILGLVWFLLMIQLDQIISIVRNHNRSTHNSRDNYDDDKGN